MSTNRDPAAVGARGDGVPDHILDDRLQDERRHERAHREAVDLECDLEALAESHLLHREIAARDIQLLGQWNVVATRPVERGAEKIGEPRDHRGRVLVAPLRDQRRDRVE